MTLHNPTESKQKVCLVFACEREQERKREQMSKKMKNVYETLSFFTTWSWKFLLIKKKINPFEVYSATCLRHTNLVPDFSGMPLICFASSYNCRNG